MSSGEDEERRIERLEKEIDLIKSKLDDLTDMKMILTELKVITEHQVKRSDKLEKMVEELTHRVGSESQNNQNNNSIPISEIVKYTLFAILGIVIAYVFKMPPN